MRTNRLITTSLVCGFMLSIPVLSWADTPVSGPIVGNVSWTTSASPYRVVGNIIVMSGSSLTIEPGVTVRFDGTNALQIDGRLVSRGTETQPITFTPSDTNYWGYIYFRTASVDAAYDGNGNYVSGSILEYCTIEKAGGASVSNNAALRLDDAHPFIAHCKIRDNNTTGIYAWDISGTLKIVYCEILNNSGGVSAIAKSNTEPTITIENCDIIENTITNLPGAGIAILGDNIGHTFGTVNILRNTIMGNETIWTWFSQASGGGIYIGPSDTAAISSNHIAYNTAGASGGGIYINGGNVTVSDNIITNNQDLDNPTNPPICGGGIAIGNGIVNIVRNLIIENTSAGWGGGIYLSGGTTTVSNNIIGDNNATVNGGAIAFHGGIGDILNNSLFGNGATSGGAIYGCAEDKSISNNTIAENNTTGSDGPATVFINSTHPLFNYNNIISNNSSYDYDVWNNNLNTSVDVNAVSNWWGTNVASEIENKIYHFVDDSSKGLVGYFPFDNQIRTDCPVSPVTALSVSTTVNSIILSWNVNPEPDITGYKVYWGPTEPPLFGNVANVGNSTNYTISPLSDGMYYIGVTAYDSDYNPANEDPDTILNDNMTNGNESAYTSTLAFIGTDPRSLILVSPIGDELITAGTHYDITWDSAGVIRNVLIELSTDNGSSWQTIITALNDGSYSWLVPQVNSDHALVRISDSSNLMITDTSDSTFIIFICNKSLSGDINKDCYVDFLDFSVMAQEWLECGNQFDPLCDTENGGW